MIARKVWISLALMILAVTSPGAAAQEPVVLHYWGLGGQHPVIDGPIVEAFNEKYRGRIRVEYESGFTEPLLTRIAGGLKPDIIGLQDGVLYQFISNGTLKDITPFFERDTELRDLMHPLTAARGTWQGRQYTLSVATGLGAMQSLVMYYNPTVFSEAGVEPPPKNPAEAWNWSTFVNNAIRLTRRTPDGNVTIWGADPVMRWQALLHTFDATFFDRDTGAFAFASPQGLQLVDSWQDLIHAHRAAPRTGEPGGGRVGFEQGSVSMILEGSWHPRTTWRDMDVSWDVGVLPVGSGATHASTMVWGDTIGLHSDTPHPEEAWLFLSELINVRWEIEEYGRLGQLERFPDEFVAQNQYMFDFVAQYARSNPLSLIPLDDAVELSATFVREVINRVRSQGDVHAGQVRELQDRLNAVAGR